MNKIEKRSLCSFLFMVNTKSDMDTGHRQGREELLDPAERSGVIKMGPHFLFQGVAEKNQLDVYLAEVFGKEMIGKLPDMAAYMIINEDYKMICLEAFGFNLSLFNNKNFNDSTIGEILHQI
ncbi:hypothetical protein [Holdemania massiliensis]|uniref:hypothetical protein n=1 Tax=Holdemania massiliensis TaxID=1468449 RepID=UPI001F067BA8|nr:hypothetical protein [Holdemania massiliensis]MCH1939392.1 hypothetical protein [Holdemania massiliensis]